MLFQTCPLEVALFYGAFELQKIMQNNVSQQLKEFGLVEP